MDVSPNIFTWPTRISPSRVRVSVTIPGEPLSKQRPRFAVNKNGSVYTPRRTKDAEEAIGWAIKSAHVGLFPNAEQAFGVRVFFMLKGGQRRDIDNMCKLVFDACNGVVWADDSQVIELSSIVIRGAPEPRTELLIYALPVIAKLTAKCALCGTEYRTYPSWRYRQYCSARCRNTAARTGEKVPCQQCGVLVYRPPYKAAGKFCSNECWRLFTTVELTCMQCSKTFRRPKSQHRPRHKVFCSEPCMSEFMRARGVKSIAGTCRVCGGPVSRREYTRCKGCRIAQEPIRSPGSPVKVGP